MRGLAQSSTGTGRHNILQEALQSVQIISGKIKEDFELNNIHHLAGILPPTVASDTNKVNQTEFKTKVEIEHMYNIKQNMQKQILSLNS